MLVGRTLKIILIRIDNIKTNKEKIITDKPQKLPLFIYLSGNKCNCFKIVFN